MSHSPKTPTHVITVKTTGLRLMLHGGDPVDRLTIETQRENWRTSEERPAGAERPLSSLEIMLALHAGGDCVQGHYVVVSNDSGWSAGAEAGYLSVFPTGGIPKTTLGPAHDEVVRALAEHVKYLVLAVPTSEPSGATAHPRHLTITWNGSQYERSPDGWVDGPFVADGSDL